MTRRVLNILLAGVLTAVGTGCGSDNPTAFRSPAVDTAPPSAPTQLGAGAVKRVVKLAWRANTTDADLQGYLVYRLAFGEVWPLTPEAVTENSFVDRSPLLGSYDYAVAAVDQAGNESVWATLRFNYQIVDSRASDIP